MEEKTKKRISLLGCFYFLASVVVTSIIGISLPKTINLINHLSTDAFYGHIASYGIATLLFWLLTQGYSLYTNRESLIQKSVELLKSEHSKYMIRRRYRNLVRNI